MTLFDPEAHEFPDPWLRTRLQLEEISSDMSASSFGSDGFVQARDDFDEALKHLHWLERERGYGPRGEAR